MGLEVGDVLRRKSTDPRGDDACARYKVLEVQYCNCKSHEHFQGPHIHFKYQFYRMGEPINKEAYGYSIVDENLYGSSGWICHNEYPLITYKFIRCNEKPVQTTMF